MKQVLVEAMKAVGPRARYARGAQNWPRALA